MAISCLYPDRSSHASLKHRERIKICLAELKYPKLSPDLVVSCEEPITQEDMGNIKNLPKGKSPELDRFNSIYYGKCSQLLLSHMRYYLNSLTKYNILPEALMAYVTVIPK